MLPYNANLKEYSRQLRDNMTDAERRLWAKIRMKQLNGYQFYRQKPIGGYIVDFYCPRAKLVIEVDGGQHFSNEKVEDDRIRDEHMRSLGLRVLRFANSDVLTHIEGVLEKIKEKTEIPLSPPLQKGETRPQDKRTSPFRKGIHPEGFVLKENERDLNRGNKEGKVEKMKDARFEEIREGIYQELLKANQHFKIYWGMRLAPKDVAKVMNVYLTFFYYTIWSHHDRFCLAIYNVTKCDDDTANFQKLFNYIKSNRDLSKIFTQKEINEMEGEILSHQELIDRLKVIRDQYVAHNQLDKKHLEGEPAYTYEEGKILLEDLNKILEDLSNKYDKRLFWRDQTNLLEVSPSLNVEDMLRNLTEHRNDQRKRTREAVKQARTSTIELKTKETSS